MNLAHSSSLSLSLSFVCIFVCHLGNSTSVLVTKCAYYAISDNDYKNFVKISDIKNSQPDGFILRIILYIQGARDGHILLATSNHPNFERDFVYEFGKFNFRHNFQVAKIYWTFINEFFIDFSLFHFISNDGLVIGGKFIFRHNFHFC